MNTIKQLTITLFCLLTVSVYAEDFTLGIYGVDNPQDIAVVKDAGFNTIQTYKKDIATITALADEAKKQNMKIVANPQEFFKTFNKKTSLDLPVSAWYLYDEPDVNSISRDTLKDIDNKTKLFFPKYKTTFVIGQGKTEMPFYDIADILMVDWYPVPHFRLESLGKQIALAKEEFIKIGLKDKPLWAVIQIFDWKEYKQFRPDNDRIGRFPTKDEIRFMSYDAIFNGATGLFYFIYTSKDIPLPKAKPENWQDIKEVVSEISKTTKLIENGKEIETPQIYKPLQVKTYLYENTIYIILINQHDKYVKIHKDFLKSNIKVLFSKQTKLKKIIKKSMIPPYSVWILKKSEN
ncbi:MAG: hypothetical protein PHR82_02705 [Endomicrobiaceae bacterium]|nr:hypothetical protein [Endomicrobiaceae bacterium]